MNRASSEVCATTMARSIDSIINTKHAQTTTKKMPIRARAIETQSQLNNQRSVGLGLRSKFANSTRCSRGDARETHDELIGLATNLRLVRTGYPRLKLALLPTRTPSDAKPTPVPLVLWRETAITGNHGIALRHRDLPQQRRTEAGIYDFRHPTDDSFGPAAKSLLPHPDLKNMCMIIAGSGSETE